MGEAAHAAGGGMDIKEQKSTFSAFVHGGAWAMTLIGMSVALLVTAFAAGMGWFAGVVVYVLVGALAGLLLRMGGAWWATLVGTAALLAIGGGVVALVA